MTPAALEKLKELRTRLEALPAWPWDSIKTWIVSAQPLIERAFQDNLSGFKEATKEPGFVYNVLFHSEDVYGNAIGPTGGTTDSSTNQRIAERAKANIVAFMSAIIDLAEMNLPTQAAHGSAGPQNVHHHYGNTFSHSNVGAVAAGPGSTAGGSVITNQWTQQQHLENITKAQSALVHDQDAIEQLGEGINDALYQLLRVARGIQIEQKNIADIQLMLKDAVDDIWAEKVAEKLRSKVLPASLEVMKTLLGSPVMAEVAKKLIGVP